MSSNAFFAVPFPANEPVLNYAPGSPERKRLEPVLAQMGSSHLDVPIVIGGQEVRTEDKRPLSPPHDHQRVIGHYHRGNAAHVKLAIDAALAAKPAWENLPWEQRAAIFLKAADLLSGPFRDRMNAATMLAQSKNIYQSEIDAVAELCDFFRFNAWYMRQIYQDQPPHSPAGIWNRMEYRALEGFVFCITPFNFTSIAANLPASAAMMGNVCVWKPADSQIYSAQIVMELFRAAGLPDGVINLVLVDGPEAGEVVFQHPEFAGLHFTGSTGVFQNLWKTIGMNISRYRSYPRIVGETGGKDYIFAHPSADAKAVAVAMSRGAFEFQGQNARRPAGRIFPDSLFDQVMEAVKADMASFRMGPPDDFGNFINAVIDERAFDKIASYIDRVKASDDAEVVMGGNYDKSKGYFIEPTLVVTRNPHSLTMEEEIFGPVLTVYRYADADVEATFDVLDQTSPYALTGAFFAQDRYAIQRATERLRHTAGNFYINDKPTGAVVGQQPFGGARGSGTNDKAGSYLNLLRWVSPRTIKENFVPPHNYRYPFLGE